MKINQTITSPDYSQLLTKYDLLFTPEHIELNI